MTRVDVESYRRHYSRAYVHDSRCSTDVLNLCDKIEAINKEKSTEFNAGWNAAIDTIKQMAATQEWWLPEAVLNLKVNDEDH